ncbi:MAG: ankyrin repeat domain-containing protein [Spirochaetota bacterium]
MKRFICLVAVASCLLAQGVSKNVSPNSALIEAAAKGDIVAIDAALAQNADINTRDNQGKTPLMLAAYNGHEKAVKHLLDKKADKDLLDPKGWSALACGVSQQKWDAVMILLERGVSVNTKDADKGNTPLMWAAYHGNIKVTKNIVGMKANVNEVDNAGWTALMGAIYKARVDVALFLIELTGTDVAVKAKDGATA